MEQDGREVVRRRPTRALSPHVASYVGYRFDGLAPGTHQGLPSRNLTFILSLDGRIDLVKMPGPQTPGSFDAFVAGMQERPATIAHQGQGAGLNIELSPLGARALLGSPAGPIAGLVVELSDLVGPAAATLLDRVRSAPTWTQRFDVLDIELVRLLRPPGRTPGVVTQAWARLLAADGRVGVARLATDLGVSRRHVTATFTAEIGISPKVAARVLRFERTRRLLDQGMSHAQAAARGGYYDQSHMVAEWHALAGATPTAWQADAVRDRTARTDAL